MSDVVDDTQDDLTVAYMAGFERGKDAGQAALAKAQEEAGSWRRVAERCKEEANAAEARALAAETALAEMTKKLCEAKAGQ